MIHIWWHRYWVTGFLILSALIGCTSTQLLWQDVGKPFGGFLAYYNGITDAWYVDKATPTWWSGIQSGDLAVGDTLVTLDGAPYREQQAALYRAAQQQPWITLKVWHEGDYRDTRVPVVRFTVAHFVDIKLPDILIGLGFWLLALVVYRAAPTTPLNRLFAVSSSMLALNRWLEIDSLFATTTLLTRILDLIGATLFGPFAGALFFHFALSFPTPIAWHRSKLLALAYGLATLIAGLYALSRILFWTQGHSQLVSWLDKQGYYNMWNIFMAGLGAIVLRLAWMILRSHRSRRERNQALLLLLGFIVAAPFILIRWAATVGSDAELFWNNVDLRFLYLAIPLAFAFIILRYQAFRGAPPLFVGVLMLTGSALLANLASALVYHLTPAWLTVQRFPLWAAMLVPLLLTSVFWSTQGSWRGMFGRLLHWEEHSYSAVWRFGQRVIAGNKLIPLPERIARAVVEELQLELVGLWLWSPEDGNLILSGQAGHWSPPVTILSVSQDMMASLPNVIRFTQTHGQTWLTPLVATNSLDLVVPLRTPETLVGLLALGKRWDEEVLVERDVQIVELIAQQITLFLLTDLQTDRLQQVPRRLAEAQERERFKIAQELHDTIQQFLGRLPFFLEISRLTAYEDPDEAAAVLEHCLTDVEQAAQIIRQIRMSLAPHELKAGFAQPLIHLADGFSWRTGIPVQVDMPATVDALLSLEARHVLYRVLQQGLDNIAAHAGATEVKVRVLAIADEVHFSIRDNGRGFSDEQRITREAQGGFGLPSMEARVDSLGGSLRIDSRLGAGTLIEGSIPATSHPSLPPHGAPI